MQMEAGKVDVSVHGISTVTIKDGKKALKLAILWETWKDTLKDQSKD